MLTTILEIKTWTGKSVLPMTFEMWREVGKVLELDRAG